MQECATFVDNRRRGIVFLVVRLFGARKQTLYTKRHKNKNRTITLSMSQLSALGYNILTNIHFSILYEIFFHTNI